MARNLRKSGARGYDHLRLVLHGQGHDLVVVDALGLLVHPIRHDLVVPAAAVDRAAVGEVPAVHQIEAHHHVALIDQGLVDGRVGRRARERLDVDKQIANRHAGRAKGLGRAALGERFQDVDVVGAFIVAPVRITPEVSQLRVVVEQLGLAQRAHVRVRVALGIQVVKDRADRLKHRMRRRRRARDHHQFAKLAGLLMLDELGDGGVDFGQAATDQIVIHGMSLGARMGAAPYFTFERL
jgi:hypothetical protein